jgi:hypothetical protein
MTQKEVLPERPPHPELKDTWTFYTRMPLWLMTVKALD